MEILSNNDRIWNFQIFRKRITRNGYFCAEIFEYWPKNGPADLTSPKKVEKWKNQKRNQWNNKKNKNTLKKIENRKKSFFDFWKSKKKSGKEILKENKEILKENKEILKEKKEIVKEKKKELKGIKEFKCIKRKKSLTGKKRNP